MASNGLAPMDGVELDPILDPEGQQIDPAFDTPADDSVSPPDPLVQLSEFGQLASTITDDPITLLVAQIHEEIEQILRMHRDIYDGIELATEQVQDKRIEFLEAGPEVTLADFFIETALAFLLGSPLLGNILKQAFRFVGAKAVASRVARLQQLEKAVQQTRGQEKNVFNELTTIRETLQTNQIKQLTASGGPLHQLRQQEFQIRDNLSQAQAKYRGLTNILKQADTAQQKTAVGEKELKDFFKEANETIAKDYGGAVVKAAGGAVKTKRPTPEPKPTAAPDSFGVQLLSLAQFTLRNVEMYVGQAAADADMLRSIVQNDPVLRQDCFNLLSQMYAALQRAEQQETKNQQSIDARQAAMLEFEKVIWAMQMPQELQPLKPDEIQQLRKDEPEPPGFGAGAATAGKIVARELRNPKPPKRLRQYLKDRLFLDNDKVTTNDIQKILNGIRQDFIEKSHDNPPIEIVKDLIFKPEPDSGGTPGGTASPVRP